MGGFVLVRDGQETVLDYESFVKGDLAYEVAFPTVTAKEILDKSRGDFLSKSIAILQSIWFIVECITRGKEGLALTELELVTLALASLNGVMYFLWWDKPLGVKEPIKVYLRNADPPKMFLEKHAEEVCIGIDYIIREMFTAEFRNRRIWSSLSFRSFVIFRSDGFAVPSLNTIAQLSLRAARCLPLFIIDYQLFYRKCHLFVIKSLTLKIFLLESIYGPYTFPSTGFSSSPSCFSAHHCST